MDDTLKYRNPPGTKPEDAVRINYRTSYCSRQGHTNCCYFYCLTKSKTKEDQEVAKNKVVTGEAVKKELQQVTKDCGMLWLILSLLNRFCSVVLKLPHNYVDNIKL